LIASNTNENKGKPPKTRHGSSKKKQGMGILSPDTSVRHSNYFIVIIVIFKKEGEKVEGNFLI
jgi:hypothetical protein